MREAHRNSCRKNERMPYVGDRLFRLKSQLAKVAVDSDGVADIVAVTRDKLELPFLFDRSAAAGLKGRGSGEFERVLQWRKA